MKNIAISVFLFFTFSCRIESSPIDGDNCGSTKFTTTSRCDETQKRFYEYRDSNADYFKCFVDDDCELYSTSLDCDTGAHIETCPYAISKNTRAEYDTEIDKLISEICACHYGSCYISLCPGDLIAKCKDQQCYATFPGLDAGIEDAHEEDIR